MVIRARILAATILLCSLLLSPDCNAQMMQDTASVNLIMTGVKDIYNMQFREAGVICNKIQRMYPDHPANLLLGSLLTYWQHYPLIPSSSESSKFVADLRECIRICSDNDDQDDAEILLTNLCARGFLLLYYSDNNMSIDVMPLAASTYKYIRKAFQYLNSFPDFSYFAGLYNYYREAYPEAYPIYKSFAFIFPSGSKSEGIKQIRKASESSIFLKAESIALLSFIYQVFEKDIPVSLSYIRLLSETYPQNSQFRAVYIKNLLLAGKYNDAEILLRDQRGFRDNDYYQARLAVFKGILYEKKYSDYKTAENFYLNGLRMVTPFGDLGNEYAAYACIGLSRICKLRNDLDCYRHYSSRAKSLYNLTSQDPN